MFQNTDKFVTMKYIKRCIFMLICIMFVSCNPLQIAYAAESVINTEINTEEVYDITQVKPWDIKKEPILTRSVSLSGDVTRFQMHYTGVKPAYVTLISPSGKEYSLNNSYQGDEITIIAKASTPSNIKGVNLLAVYICNYNETGEWTITINKDDVAGKDFAFAQTKVSTNWQYLKTETNMPIESLLGYFLSMYDLNELLKVSTQISIESEDILGETEIIQEQSYIHIYIGVLIVIIIVAVIIVFLLNKHNKKKDKIALLEANIENKKKESEITDKEEYEQLKAYLDNLDKEYTSSKTENNDETIRIHEPLKTVNDTIDINPSVKDINDYANDKVFEEIICDPDDNGLPEELPVEELKNEKPQMDNSSKIMMPNVKINDNNNFF